MKGGMTWHYRLRVRYALWQFHRTKLHKHSEGFSIDRKRWWWWGWKRGKILPPEIVEQLRELARPATSAPAPATTAESPPPP